ncbi:septal ring lytic transglycosylase RlpA family protein [Microbulbifer sp. EKSA008]|uniref:septal ring lytic transglycosylase RlpA family protein n=1 Tax=unclassified Microbulbifer TaxID=2619833 RepID=UPI0024AE68BA|nr:septal ring lytic transglycosylase RlpA family protein [Microbulbifer sp. VAAF005]WHI45792.1 septal ring lytic transglycosylase RlpA family protein [Microbulbifer sp. VAAF005]WNZ55490.1 septal ring lytic transglycosylase RlpA family protein [Microbulbifer sp. MKSA007]
MFQCKARWGVALAVLILAACSGPQPKPQKTENTKQPDFNSIKDSGPAAPVNMQAAPEPIPVREPIGDAGNKSPYKVNGVTYRVRNDVKGYKEVGQASWYGTKFHGRRTANGEVYNMYAMSAAHKTLPLPSYAKVTNLDNGRSIIVRVNDRGPFVHGRIIDLSYTAAQKLGYIDKGIARVEVEALDPAALPAANEVLANSDGTAGLAEDTTIKLPDNTYLQVGAYSSSAQAQEIRTQLAAAIDYPVAVSSVQSGGKTYYRVRIGPLTQQRALATARETVEQKQFGQPQVVYE